jgi:hypothetical protein
MDQTKACDLDSLAAAWLLLAVLDSDNRLPPEITSPESLRALTGRALGDPNGAKAIAPHLITIEAAADIFLSGDIAAWVQSGELRAITDKDDRPWLVSRKRLIELGGIDHAWELFHSDLSWPPNIR